MLETLNIKIIKILSKILILHPCMQDDPTFKSLFEDEEVSLVVTGSDSV